MAKAAHGISVALGFEIGVDDAPSSTTVMPMGPTAMRVTLLSSPTSMNIFGLAAGGEDPDATIFDVGAETFSMGRQATMTLHRNVRFRRGAGTEQCDALAGSPTDS